MLRVRAAVRGQAEDTACYFMAMEGMIPRDAFFNPDNLERLLGPNGPAPA